MKSGLSHVVKHHECFVLLMSAGDACLGGAESLRAGQWAVGHTQETLGWAGAGPCAGETTVAVVDPRECCSEISCTHVADVFPFRRNPTLQPCCVP